MIGRMNGCADGYIRVVSKGVHAPTRTPLAIQHHRQHRMMCPAPTHHRPAPNEGWVSHGG